MPSKPRSLAGILHRRRTAEAEYDRARRGDPDRGVEDAVVSSARWKALCAQVLRDEPICRGCATGGRTELATQVDHVVPVRVRPDLAFDLGNCQPLCTSCHALKSSAERAASGTPSARLSPPKDHNHSSGNHEREECVAHHLVGSDGAPGDGSQEVRQPDGDDSAKDAEDDDDLERLHDGILPGGPSGRVLDRIA